MANECAVCAKVSHKACRRDCPLRGLFPEEEIWKYLVISFVCKKTILCDALRNTPPGDHPRLKHTYVRRVFEVLQWPILGPEREKLTEQFVKYFAPQRAHDCLNGVAVFNFDAEGNEVEVEIPQDPNEQDVNNEEENGLDPSDNEENLEDVVSAMMQLPNAVVREKQQAEHEPIEANIDDEPINKDAVQSVAKPIVTNIDVEPEDEDVVQRVAKPIEANIDLQPIQNVAKPIEANIDVEPEEVVQSVAKLIEANTDVKAIQSVAKITSAD